MNSDITKVSWITAYSFIEVDLPILAGLANDSDYCLSWSLIVPHNRFDKFTYKAIDTYLSQGEITYKIVNLLNRMTSLSTLIEFISLLWKIRCSKPDVVYVNGEFGPFFSVLLRIIIGRKKTILAVHDVIPHFGTSKVISFFNNIKIKMFIHFHIFSKTQLSNFEKTNPTKLTFCIPLFLQNYGVPKENRNTDIINFLFFGTIRENKGIEYLIEAVNNMNEKYREKFKINIYGGCKNWEKYHVLIRKEWHFNLNIHPVPYGEVAQLYGSSHYLILPYRDVTQSGPLMLAFNYNVVPIVSRLPGFEENVKENVTGYFFDSQNSESLRGTLGKIIENHDKEYLRVSKNLEVYVKKNFNITSFLQEYKNMFRKVK